MRRAATPARCRVAPERRQTIIWRLFGMIGAFSYLLGRMNPVGIEGLSDGQCDPGDRDQAMRQIDSFVLAGFLADEPAP